MPRTASTAAKSTTRTPRASAKTGAAQHANQENLKNEGSAPQPAPSADDLMSRAAAIQAQVEADRKAGMPTAPAPAPTFQQGAGFVDTKLNDANLQSPRIGHAVLVSNIVKAGMDRKSAITLEVAVVLAVFCANGSSSKSAKKELYTIYKEAGYDCTVGGDGKDYNTVNRRINYVTKFFDSLKVEELNAIMGETKGEEALKMVCNWLSSKYIFRSMNDVLVAAGAPVPPQTHKPKGAEGGTDQGGNAGGNQGGGNQQPPSGGGAAEGQGQSVFQTSATATPTGTPQPSEADKGVMAAMQQAGAQREQAAQDNSLRFTFEGATLLVPKDYKVECLHDLGMKLLNAAMHMKGADRVNVEALNAEFAAVAAH